MSVAYISSYRSKDDRTKVGACIVNKDNRIISTGYNGMPNGCNDDEMPWELGEGLKNKHLYVVHAELNAIINSKTNLNNCILYTTLFPCNECTKAIIQSGIKEVVFLSDKFKDYDQFKASKIMMDKCNIKYRKLISCQGIKINLNCEEVN
jgi:dCMP deaminase